MYTFDRTYRRWVIALKRYKTNDGHHVLWWCNAWLKAMDNAQEQWAVRNTDGK